MMYNLAGSFGPWELYPGHHADVYPPQAAFHFWERAPDGTIRARTLATDDVLPAWPRLKKGDAQYHALFPKAWLTYKAFCSAVSLKVFSPIVKDNYRETSYPVAVFQFLVANPTTDSYQVSVMFTFPNLPYARPGKARTGLINTVRQGEDGFLAVVMAARSSMNTAETEGTEWVIASALPYRYPDQTPIDAGRHRITYRAVWEGAGDGAGLWLDFVEDGELTSQAEDAAQPSGALAVRVDLLPGEAAVIPFILAWDFPVVEFGSGAKWYRRYTEYFGGPDRANPGRAYPYGQGVEIARLAVREHRSWEAAVDSWYLPIVNHPAYPDWLKSAALNELYYATFGGVFWENGPLNFQKPVGDVPGRYLYAVMESHRYPYAETLDVRHYQARHRLVLWPAIERDVLLAWAEMVLADPLGRVPHDAGWMGEAPRARQDPYRRWDAYGTREKGWKDLSSRFIQQAWAYYATTGDYDFLTEVWPSVKRTYAYLKSLDRDGNGLPDNEGHDTTYDTLPLYGSTSLTANLWIGALEAVFSMARLLHDPVVEEVSGTIERARRAFQEELWDSQQGYYRIDTDGPFPRALQADALNGQRYNEVYGLPDVAPLERLLSHYHRTFEWAVRPGPDFTGDGIGDVGAANVVMPGGCLVGEPQGDEVWAGTTYFIAAQMYRAGKRAGDLQLMRRALLTAYGVYYQTYLNERTAYWFATPEGWSFANPARYRALQYQRPLAVWELLLEVADPFARQLTQSEVPTAAELWAEMETSSATSQRPVRPPCARPSVSLTEDVRLFGGLIVDVGNLALGPEFRAGDGRTTVSVWAMARPRAVGSGDSGSGLTWLPGAALDSPVLSSRHTARISWEQRMVHRATGLEDGFTVTERPVSRWRAAVRSGAPGKERWIAGVEAVSHPEAYVWAEWVRQTDGGAPMKAAEFWRSRLGGGWRNGSVGLRLILERGGRLAEPGVTWTVQTAVASPGNTGGLGALAVSTTDVACPVGESLPVLVSLSGTGNDGSPRVQWMLGVKLGVERRLAVGPAASVSETTWGIYACAARLGASGDAAVANREASSGGLEIKGRIAGADVRLALAVRPSGGPLVRLVSSRPIRLW